MNRIGRIGLDGRIIYSAGRGILQAKDGMVIFSDGSSINLKTGVITNLSPELPLTLDIAPTGFDIPVQPKPEEKRYKSSVLKLTGIDWKQKIMPHDSREIIIPADENLSSEMVNGVVHITKVESGTWDSIYIRNVSGMSITASFLTVGSGIVTASLSSQRSSSNSVIYVPYGTQIILKDSDGATIGDVNGAIIVSGNEDVSLKVGSVQSLSVITSSDVSLVATGKINTVKIDAGEDVSVTSPFGCAEMIVKAGADVSVVCEGKPVDKSLFIQAGEDISVKLNVCLGNVRTIDSENTTLRANRIDGNVTVNCSVDASLTIAECAGQITVTGGEDISLRSDKHLARVNIDAGEDLSVKVNRMGEMDFCAGEDISVTANAVNGSINANAGEELSVTVLGGEIGAVKVDAGEDANVTIKAVIASIIANVGEDGRFRILGCAGRQQIEVDGDDSIRIG